jgi:hypothetical protein
MKEPRRCEGGGNLSQIRRNVFCKHYNSCLDHAISKNWDGFTCVNCDGYEREQWDHEQWCEDSIRCLRLVWAVSYSGLKQPYRRRNTQRQIIAINHGKTADCAQPHLH